jgi:hypothetical protein
MQKSSLARKLFLETLAREFILARMDRIKPTKDNDLIQAKTAEELKQMAASFETLPKEFQISAEELEILQEETLGKEMHYGTSAVAIEAMTARLNVLRKQKEETLSALDICEDENLQDTLTRDLDTLNSQISETQIRLALYKFQQQQEN